MAKILGCAKRYEILAKAGKVLDKLIGHHTVPVSVLRKLPAPVANSGRVRGMKGCKNIWKIPEELHKLLHGGASGGIWNTRWWEEVKKIGLDTITADDVVRIREMLVSEFGLGVFRP